MLLRMSFLEDVMFRLFSHPNVNKASARAINIRNFKMLRSRDDIVYYDMCRIRIKKNKRITECSRLILNPQGMNI